MPENMVTVVCVDCGREDQVLPSNNSLSWMWVHPECCASCRGERHFKPVRLDTCELVQELDEHSSVAFLNNRFYNTKTGVTHKESHTEKLVDVKPFNGPVAHIRRGYGLTLNLGDYEAARFDVSITVPCYMADVDAADQWAEKWAEKRISKEVQQIRGSKDKKSAPKRPEF